jgi:hypothetical protein
VTAADELRATIHSSLADLTKHFNPDNPQLEIDCTAVLRRAARTSDYDELQRLLRRTFSLRRRVEAQARMRQLMADRRAVGLPPTLHALPTSPTTVE